MKTYNPYVGPRAFEEEDSRNFFGRDVEIRQLASLVIAHRVVLLYAPSGAGKTSLLRAGLIPYLKQRKRVNILPICRVGGDLPPDVEGSQVQNVYVFDTLLDLSMEGIQPRDLIDRTLSEGLASYITPQSGQQRPQPCLLIIDQFEELFTTHIECYPERADFFFQLQHTLQEHPQLSLLLSMREDYIAQLDPYTAQLPDRLRTHFRLELLETEAAGQAVREPAHGAGVEFTDAAANHLINDLRKIQVQQPDGTTTEQSGRSIEPVQLQVVCRRLWEQLPADASQIGESDIEAVGDVDSALADYYADRVAVAAQETGVRERTIREWFDRQLITEQGIRGQVLRGPEHSQGLENQTVDLLVDAHLVRAEKRLNALWYELAHDRLIEPVRKNNASWFQAHLSPLQLQADLWERQGRSGGLLLREKALEEAEIWAAEHQDELTPTEADFLAVCREARAIAERERRQTRRILRLAVVSIVIGVIAVIAAIFALRQRELARENAELAQTRAIEAENARNLAQEAERERTRSLFESYLTHASMLARIGIEDYAAAREILNKSRALDEDIPAERRHARNVLAWYTDLMGNSPIRTYTGAEMQLFNVALSPDGRLLAATGEKGTVVLLDPQSGKVLKHLQGHTQNVLELAFHQQGDWLVTGGDDGRIIFWSLPEGDKLREWEAPGEVRAMALSPDGTRLASGGTDNNITLWDVETGKALKILEGHSAAIAYFGLAFSPNGRLLASGSADQTARIWDVETGEYLRSLSGHAQALNGIAFHPDGRILATSSDDRRVRLWDVGSGKPLRILSGHTNEVNDLTFIHSGQRLVSGSRDYTLRIWDVDSGVTLRVLQGHTGGVSQVIADDERLFSASVDRTIRSWDISREERQRKIRMVDLPALPLSCAIAPDSSHVAVGFADGTLQLYTLPAARLVWNKSNAHPKAIISVVFSPDGRHLASVSHDQSIKLWQINNRQLQYTFSGYKKKFWRATFSPDGMSLAATCSDGQIGLFDLSKQEGRFYEAHQESAAYSVAFDASGQRLLTTGQDGETKLWNLASWPPTLLQGFPKAPDRMLWAIFSPDESRIASVGLDLRLRILHVRGGDEEQVLSGHEDIINRAAFSPDSQQVATVSTDATIRFWDLREAKELFILRLPTLLASRDFRTPLRDFDFRCGAASDGNCWIAVPLARGKLVLYDLGQPYD